MREASFKLIGLPPHRNSTPMSLQNDHEDGTLHRTEKPLGTRVHMKVFTLERSEGVGMLVVERHRPPYNRWNDSTIIELGRESTRQEICGARGNRATRAAFNSTTTTMDRREGPLDVLKGWQWPPAFEQQVHVQNSLASHAHDSVAWAIESWLYTSSAKTNHLQYNMKLHQLSD